jgi:glycosyltransferase involved in cell wall biosynthesis
LACGTPVITFDTGGSIESIDKSCGVVVEKGNISLLKNEISELKGKIISRENCNKKAKEYDKHLKFKEYINLYEKILKS